jgi:predicted exporter/lauroyl/myristoyl acyltransferase
MKPRWFRWWWLCLLIPLLAGAARLRFDVEILDLLPANTPAVAGLKVYQQHFSSARELIITLQAPDADTAEKAAGSIAGQLRAETNLIAEVDWQPPWVEHPEQTAELIAYLWLNQPPDIFQPWAGHFAESNLPGILSATRQRLATTLSPTDLAQLSYDPLGFTQLPRNAATPDFAKGGEFFASADGSFRLIFVEARDELRGYRECTAWLNAVKKSIHADGCTIGYTGRPAFVAEISASMQHDIKFSVLGTSLIIAVLFWLAHRRVKPMLWLLALLALILGATLAMGGLIFGTVSIISMGFAAILLGLAVDYAVVHYQEALAQPELSVPEIRRAIAPSIFWAAVTTISAFLVLNFCGLPGLAQLGSLVAIGVALAALVMIFAFLPPLFPDRMQPRPHRAAQESESKPEPLTPLRARLVFAGAGLLLLICAAVLRTGFPGMDASTHALEPRNSPAYAALDMIRDRLGQKHEPLWLVAEGRNESEVGQKLDAIEPVLRSAVSNGLLTGYTSPAFLWPRPEFQAANRAAVQRLISERDDMRRAVLAGGFSEAALGLTDEVLNTWQRAAAQPGVFWPSNHLCDWIFAKVAARDTNRIFAAAFLYPAGAASTVSSLESQLPREGVWLSSWETLGASVLATVKHNLWKMLLPMAALVLFSLWLAFQGWREILLSLAVLLFSGVCLLAVMQICGWSWNVLNLMALPLILGTGVDYSIFMQLALRRHHGSLRQAQRSVGRALLLCGGTAIAGFSSLGLSSNAGMASLGRVCAVGIAGNVLLSVLALPVWWKALCGGRGTDNSPSQLYRASLWRLGLKLGASLSPRTAALLARMCGAVYWRLAWRRRQVVLENLRPVLGDSMAARQAARQLFDQFSLKMADLWRYESGVKQKNWFSGWQGWEHFAAAHARGQGVLLITPHLGNWEFGGAFLVEKGYRLLVLTQAEPDAQLTKIRQASRARWGVETLVVGDDPFAIVEIIKCLQAGAAVALLVDRPPAPTAVTVELFGRPFSASIAPAELARASGCAILPVIMVRRPDGYEACISPEIPYDRAAIGDRAGRIRLTQEIVRAFEPAIRQNVTQWYHFVPIWPPGG